MIQSDLFSAAGMRGSVVIPPAPELDVRRFEAYPYPGLTAKETAQACLSLSVEFVNVIAAVIQSQGGASMTEGQVIALIPDDWKKVLGRWLNGSLSKSQGEKHGIDVKYVYHEGGGFHFEFKAVGIEALKAYH